MNKIFIVSDAFNSDELFEMLNVEIEEDEQLTLRVEEEPENTMPIDPTVLVALVTIGGTAITAIINGMFAVVQKALENDNKKSEAKIRIKTNDGEIEVPRDISSEELDKVIKVLETKQIKTIALITES